MPWPHVCPSAQAGLLGSGVKACIRAMRVINHFNSLPGDTEQWFAAFKSGLPAFPKDLLHLQRKSWA